MAKMMVFANQKGGVGKTTLALHAALYGNRTDARVLFVDMDQQASSGYMLSGNGNIALLEDGVSPLDLWFPEKDVEPLHSELYGVDYLPGNARLDRVDDSITDGVAALRRLRELFDDEYDFIIVDGPPAPGVRQLAPLLVADIHVVPVTPDRLGTQGIAATLGVHKQHIQPSNPHLQLHIVVNRLKANSPTNRAIAEALQNKLGPAVLPQVLYEREDVKSGLYKGAPYWERTKDSQRQAWWDAFDTLCGGIVPDESELDDEGGPDE
jgi:chromosome partitioning protein